MRIDIARAQMISARNHLSQREEDTARMLLENPAIRLHGGPRERYNVACKHFVVAQLEHILTKRDRNRMELMAAREELGFSRQQFFRNQEVNALENRRNQFNYEIAQKRFTYLHKRLRSLRTEPIIQDAPIEEDFPIKEELPIKEE
jgi:hypothetical protein